MQKSLIRTVSGWRFEVPLALALAAAGIFMVAAIPPGRLTAFPGLIAFPAAQLVLATIFGVVIGAAGFVAMRYPWPLAAEPQFADAMEEDGADDDGQPAGAETALRLRRADRHPDAPARAPIFASRDLGSPFMEAGAFAPPPEDEAHETEIPEGDYAELDDHRDAAFDAADEPAVNEAAVNEAGFDEAAVDEAVMDEAVMDGPAGEEPVAHEAVTEEAPAEAPVTDVSWSRPVTDVSEPEPIAPIAAFAPDDQRVPPTARAQRASLAAMMDRLSAGLERRAAEPVETIRPRDRKPALRDALDELNRLAARRG